ARLASATLLVVGCIGSINSEHDPAPVPAGNGGGHGAGKAAPAPACGGDATAARIWRLSDEDYRRAVADLLPGVAVPEVSTPGRSKAEFINLAELYPVAGALVADLRTAAKTVAAAATADLPARMACSPGQAERACAEA